MCDVERSPVAENYDNEMDCPEHLRDGHDLQRRRKYRLQRSNQSSLSDLPLGRAAAHINPPAPKNALG